ncbi:MAG: hypothetical protein OEZ01_00605 [Candidatus Heimdallarchaeota archaeon]|nr:hypothetical protein [Candidatus Heimdallarchaeota archaeon]
MAMTTECVICGQLGKVAAIVIPGARLTRTDDGALADPNIVGADIVGFFAVGECCAGRTVAEVLATIAELPWP